MAAAGRRSRGRAALAVVLIVLGSLLAPVAIVTAWLRVALTDTEAFVATAAPLIEDARVQAYLTGEVMGVVEQHLDIEGTVNSALDALSAALPERRGQRALQALRQPAIDGLRSAVKTAVSRAMASDAVAQAWREALRISHERGMAVLQGDPDAALVITQEGLGLRLAPLIERVKEQLIAQGHTLAARIPVVDRTILVVSTGALAEAQLAYRAAVTAGLWLTPLVVALLAGGVLASRRRAVAALWAAAGLGLGALALLAAVAAAGAAAPANVPGAPAEVVRLFYDTFTGSLRNLAGATLLLAVVAGLLAWLWGRRSATR